MGEIVITDLEMLKAISDPVRLKVLALACRDTARGWTAKELAAEIGMKQTALYRHLKTLETNGFLKVADTRMVSGITERTYAAVAPSYRVDRELLAADEAPTGAKAAAALSTFDAMFENARAEFLAGIKARLAEGDQAQRSASLATSAARLSPASVRKIQREIARLSELERYDDPDGDDYGIIIGFYPRGDVRS